MNAKQSLLRSAQDLLWERGYESTSPRDIQKHAGSGQGSFYHHYKGKLDLASQALQATAAEMIAAFAACVDGKPGDALTKLEAYLSLDRQALRGCRMGRHALESSIAEPEIRAPLQEYFEHMRADLERLAREATGCDDGAPIADALMATVQGGYVLARVHDDPARLHSALKGTAQMLRALVAAHSTKTQEDKE